MHNIPQLRDLEERFPDELVVIGVHSAKFPSEGLTANIRQAVLRDEIRHPVINDAGFRVWSEYSVRAWPTLVLIDPAGRIAYQTAGEILAADLAPQIQAILDENPDSIRRGPLELRPEARLEPAYPLRYPARLLVVEDRLWIADSGHNRILEVRLDPAGLTGEVVRVFGSGRASLQDGFAGEAAFHHPRGLALKGDVESGTLYVADTENHAIRAIELSQGQVRTVAGTGQKAHGSYALGRPTETPLRSPWAVVSLDRYLFIAMAGSHQVWLLDDEKQIGPFAGNGAEALVDGLPAEASFNQPSDLAFGLGYLFVADPEASAIRAIPLFERQKTITLVGQGLFEFGDVDGNGPTVRLQHAAGLSFSEEDSLVVIADTYNHKIKTLDPPTGEVKTLLGSGRPGLRDGDFAQAQLFEPEGVLAVGNRRLYIADTDNHQVRIADLQARQVHTLSLRGLERLAQPGIIPLAAGGKHLLAPAPVNHARPVRITLDIHLPEGYKRNPDAAALLRVHTDGQMRELSFAATEAIEFELEPATQAEISLDLTLFYCQEGELGLCLVHDRELLLPLEWTADGPDRVTISYQVM